jgi:hypothetical protein
MPMHVFTFRSCTYLGTTGFTTRRTGANLPEELGPWVSVSQGGMHDGDPVTGVYRGAQTVLAGIDRASTLPGLMFAPGKACEVARM